MRHLKVFGLYAMVGFVVGLHLLKALPLKYWYRGGYPRYIFLQRMNCICNLGQLHKQKFYLKKVKLVTDKRQNSCRGPVFVFFKTHKLATKNLPLILLLMVTDLLSISIRCAFLSRRQNLPVASFVTRWRRNYNIPSLRRQQRPNMQQTYFIAVSIAKVKFLSLKCTFLSLSGLFCSDST